MRSSRNRRRAAHASVLAGLVTSAVLVLTACGTGEGGTATQRSTLPVLRAVHRPPLSG